MGCRAGSGHLRALLHGREEGEGKRVVKGTHGVDGASRGYACQHH